MKETFKTRIYPLDPEWKRVLYNVLLGCFFAVVIWSAEIDSFGLYQKTLCAITIAVFLLTEIIEYFNRLILYVLIDTNRNINLEVRKRGKLIHSFENIEISNWGWNYRMTESEEITEVGAGTHIVNHNLVLKIKSINNKNGVNLLHKLKPWQELSPELPYLNDLDPNEINYQIKNIKKLRKVLLSKE